MLKSKNTNVPFAINSTMNTVQDSAFSITELRSCFADIPIANINGVPNVNSAPIVTIHCTRSKPHIS